MHTDANTLDNGTLIEGDICIVGAGAAGISMALEWAHTPHKVILLEGGGFEVDSDIQDLYRGENIGQKYYPLQSSRLHFFGGTTGHWGGFCARFDPWDFEERTGCPIAAGRSVVRTWIRYMTGPKRSLRSDPLKDGMPNTGKSRVQS